MSLTMIINLLSSWLKKKTMKAELGSLPRGWFPNAEERRVSYTGDLTLFYNRWVSNFDIVDLRDFVDSGRSACTIAKNIPERFVRDFLYKDARLNLIMHSPRESEVFHLLNDNPKNFGLTVILKGNANYGQVKDLRAAEEEARRKGSKAILGIYVAGSHMDWGKVKDIRDAVGQAVCIIRRERSFGAMQDIREAGGSFVHVGGSKIRPGRREDFSATESYAIQSGGRYSTSSPLDYALGKL